MCPLPVIPPQTPPVPTTIKANRMTPLPQCQPTHAPTAHGPLTLCVSNTHPPSQLSKRNRCPPSADPATSDSTRAWLHVQTRAQRAVRCRCALAVYCTMSCSASRRWMSNTRRIWARRHKSSEMRRCCIDLCFRCEGGAAITWSFVVRCTWFGALRVDEPRCHCGD